MGSAAVQVVDSLPIEQRGVCAGVNVIYGKRREESVQPFQMGEQLTLVRTVMHD